MTKKDRWILSEFLVAHDRCVNFQESLLEHQLRTPFAEVDLVFESRASATSPIESSRIQFPLTVIEVKSIDGDLWSRSPVSVKQRLRLERARSWIEAKTKKQVRLKLAVVGSRGAIQYFDFPL